jgi:coenzyme F420-0:L-glutamate ligase / coenzyme F420-1:gamma-L-glutamate ligase
MTVKKTLIPPIEIIPVTPFSDVQPEDDLGRLIVDGLQAVDSALHEGDILVITQKIVSKAENRYVDLKTISPSLRAQEIGVLTGKDPRLVEIILGESTEVVRAAFGVLLVRHRLGFVCANAGVDHSNVSRNQEQVLLLPVDPDASARRIRQRIAELAGRQPPVLIIDSQGRPWREGTVGEVIGLSGIAPIQDLRGAKDMFGGLLRITIVGFADQIAAAASLMLGQAAERIPAVIIRGLPYAPDDKASAADVLRKTESDLFR